MATSKEYLNYTLEQLSELDNIRVKMMMGEYLLYHNDILFGGIYDNRFLVKKTKSNLKYNMKEEIPYEGSKSMYLVEEIDNREILKNIVLDTELGLLKNRK